MKKFLNLLCLIGAATFFATASQAQEVSDNTPPPLPEFLKNCKEIPGLSSFGQRHYNDCFEYGSSDYYGRLFIRFDLPAFNSAQFAENLNKNQKKSLAKRIKTFLFPKSVEGHLVARVSVNRLGLNPIPEYVIELAKFTYSDQNGLKIDQSTSSINGYVGPVFNANSQSNITVKTEYVFKKTQSSNISSLIAAASRLLTGEGFISPTAAISDEAFDAIKAVENAITQNFNVDAKGSNPIQLDFDATATTAAYRRIDFAGVLDREKQVGQLFVGAIRLRSILVDVPPDETVPLVYTAGGFDDLATNPIRNRPGIIEGKSLRDFVRLNLKDGQYLDLQSSDQAKFLAASAALRNLIADSQLNLVASDQVATQWAFLASNPLMKNSIVRQQTSLHASELSGSLEKLRLDLPKLGAAPLTPEQEALMAAAISAANTADAQTKDGQSAINRAIDAANQAQLPARAAQFEYQNNGFWEYFGETSNPTKFFGALADKRPGYNGDRYEGSMSLSGTTPIYEGFGRYVRSPAHTSWAFADYTGTFVANRLSGHGTMRWANGREFRGSFAQDYPNGFGMLHEPDGAVYYARLVDGVPNGPAVKRGAGAEFIAGRWVNGVFVEGL